jgi:hypothetical protein
MSASDLVEIVFSVRDHLFYMLTKIMELMARSFWCVCPNEASAGGVKIVVAPIRGGGSLN